MKDKRNLKDLLVPVQKVKLKDLLKGYESVSKFSHAIIVTPEGNKPRIVNFCSSNYVLIENKNIIIPLEEAVRKEFNNVEVSYRHKNHSKFYIDFSIMDKTMAIKKGDLVGFRVRVLNSYDGRLKLGYEIGLMRLACTNGMVMPDKHGSSKFQSMHTPQIINRQVIDELIHSINLGIASFKEIIEPYKLLTSRTIPRVEEPIAKLMEEMAEGTKFPKRQIPEAIQIAINESKALKQEMSHWIVYQAMNNILNHSTDIKMDWHRRTDVDRDLINNFLSE